MLKQISNYALAAVLLAKGVNGLKAFGYTAGPEQAGFCVKASGQDENSGVIKIASNNVKSAAEKAECLRKCLKYGADNKYTKVTGCESIHDQGNRGCYVHTSEAIAKGNNARRHSCWLATRDAYVSACTGGVVSSFTGVCSYANFMKNLDRGCDATDLFSDIGGYDDNGAAVEPNATMIEAEIDTMCKYDAPTAFVDIQGTYQRDRRYFAGGGPLVDGGDWEGDTARLKRFEDNLSDNTIVAWPEYAARVKYNKGNGLGDNGYPANMNLETSCGLKTAMCCFTDDSDAPFDSTTDVCRHDLANSPQSNHIKKGWSVFPGAETSTHCVGFTWKEGEDELIGNMMYDISLSNTVKKGYRKGVPGAPMCGCIEHMPIVEEAKCRTAAMTGGYKYIFSYSPPVGDNFGYVDASVSVDLAYEDCADGNDLKAQYVANQGGNATKAALIDYHLVGAGGCADDLVEYLNGEHFLHQKQHATKYVTPDPARWSDIVVGEGVYFMPPAITRASADGAFRALVEAGCTDDDGATRACIVRRICSTCYASHRDVYYKRKTALPSAEVLYFLDLFMNNWKSAGNNMANGDFELYSSYEDALAGENKWTYCNYDDSGIGFPRDCGPTGYVSYNWNSYTRGGGYANHHGFYVEKPSVKKL